jgi:hypothetical protein
MAVVKDVDFAEELIGQPHTISWSAHVFSPSGDMIDVLVESGTVTLSGRNRGRTRGDVTLIDTDGTLWDPTGVNGASPYGGWVEICASLGGQECFVGSGLILDVQRERPGGTIGVAFVDYGAAVGWDNWFWPVGYSTADPMQGVMETLFESCHLTGTVIDPGVPANVAGTFIEESSRESAVQHLCTDANIVAWVDEHRRLRLQPEPVTAAMPAVYTLSDGKSGTVTRESYGLSRDGVPNYVVVTGERPQDGANPPIGSAFVTTGLFDYNGPYGRVLEVNNRPVLTTNTACDQAAATILAKEGRLQRDMTVDAVAHPCLEPGDRIDLHSGDRVTSTVLDEVRYAIGPDAMSVRLVEAL